MHPDVEGLLALQAEDEVLDDLRKRVSAIDERLRGFDRARQDAERAASEARALADEAARHQRELQERARQHRSLQDRNETQYGGARTEREARAAEAQMGQSRRMLDDAERAARDAGDEAGRLERTATERATAAGSLAGEQQVTRAALDTERGQLENELRVAEVRRADRARGVPRTVLATYDRIRGRRARAVYPVRSGSCGQCDVAIPLHRRNLMARTGGLELCEECGVLLYATE